MLPRAKGGTCTNLKTRDGAIFFGNDSLIAGDEKALGNTQLEGGGSSDNELSYFTFELALEMPERGKGRRVNLKERRTTRSFNLCMGKGKILGCEMRGFQNVHGRLGGLGLFHFLPKAQLAAGGVDVVTFLATDCGSHSSFKKSAAEEVDGVLGGSLVGKAFDFVVGDEVHFCEKTTGVLGEEGGLLQRIVDSCEENVFKENLFLFGTDKNVTGFEESVEGETFIDGHNFIADGVAGGVKGEREAKLEWVIS
jgi:hypothetical protein